MSEPKPHIKPGDGKSGDGKPTDGKATDGNPDDNPNRSWQEIAEEASKEQDPQKLVRLVGELAHALDDEHKPVGESQSSPCLDKKK